MTTLSRKDNIVIKQWAESEAGRKFIAVVKDSIDAEYDFAEKAYSRYEQPNQQIAAALNRARGMNAILDFIDSCRSGANKEKEGDQTA